MSNTLQTKQTPEESGGWPLIASLQTELNRMFDRFSASTFGTDQKLMPVLDFAETDKAVEITAEVPGVKPEDLDVSISGDMLILKGQKSDAHEDRSKDWVHIERSFGSFRRQVPLGFSPKDGKVDATFKDGVLTLRIEKPADATNGARKINISAA